MTQTGTNPTTQSSILSPEDEARVEPIKEALSDVRSTMANNKLKKEASIVQAKIDFQTMIIQYFAQRRFRHVLIGTRFYRALFGDGDNRISALDQISSSLPVDKDAGQAKMNVKLDPKVSGKGGSGGYVGAGSGATTDGNRKFSGAGADASSSGGAFNAEGMQFGIEFPGFKWSPIQYLYKNWAGLYKQGEQFLYVNRGLGFLGYPGRLGIWPEITVIELQRV
jgi:hypothetical protein